MEDKNFKYNDVDKTYEYLDSKCFSFMNKRLEIVKELLSNKVEIFISIDDNEEVYLKLLCNFV